VNISELEDLLARLDGDVEVVDGTGWNVRLVGRRRAERIPPYTRTDICRTCKSAHEVQVDGEERPERVRLYFYARHIPNDDGTWETIDRWPKSRQRSRGLSRSEVSLLCVLHRKAGEALTNRQDDDAIALLAELIGQVGP
jgi:hypothetical protein